MASDKKISILMFPWLAHGHISPFLELAKHLTHRNFDIYLCSTPATLTSVRAKLSYEYSASIKLVELHLPSDLPTLPPHLHTTNGLPPHLMQTLKEALDMSSNNFCAILDTIKPDLLIYDLLQHWAPEAAAARGIPAVEFISSSGTMTSVQFHKLKYPDKEFPFSEAIYFRDYEAREREAAERKAMEEDPNYEYEKQRGVKCLELSCKIVLIKSFNEIEGKYNDYLSSIVGKKIVPVGPLVENHPAMSADQDSDIIRWLDGKDPGSTVYVSFGSEYFLSADDLREIAYGLEMSNVNFIWALRFPKGAKGEKTSSVEEEVPLGFLDRVKGRGLVFDRWAPQVAILKHRNIGGFVSHCGWNSVMEGMKIGVPIIAMPMHLDQPINARVVEEAGVGVEVVRDPEGRHHRETIAEVIKSVVVDKLGEKLREKAKELSETMRKKGNEEIDGVVEELVSLYQNK